jgi:hypothetical protein
MSAMTKRRPGATPEVEDNDVPDWVKDDSPGRSTPYTEEELDLLVEGTLEGIQDTLAWQNLVRQVGEKEARKVLRSRLIMRDKNAVREPRH